MLEFAKFKAGQVPTLVSEAARTHLVDNVRQQGVLQEGASMSAE